MAYSISLIFSLIFSAGRTSCILRNDSILSQQVRSGQDFLNRLMYCASAWCLMYRVRLYNHITTNAFELKSSILALAKRI